MRLTTSYEVRPGFRATSTYSWPVETKQAILEAIQHILWITDRTDPIVEEFN